MADVAPGSLGAPRFYGSDAKRSPLHFMRNPGEPPYDGAKPDFAAGREQDHLPATSKQSKVIRKAEDSVL